MLDFISEKELPLSRSIYFGRHGRTENDEVTAYGMRQLAVVRERLRKVGFTAEYAASSVINRCVETARFFTNGNDPIIVPLLYAHGDAKNIGVGTMPHTEIVWYAAREYAEKTLDSVLTLPPPDRNLVVISHDENPLLLAQRYLELQGASPCWDLAGCGYIDQGEGVLVEDTFYEVIKHD